MTDGQLEAELDRVDLAIVRRDNLDLPLAPKRDRLLPMDDLQRLVRGVEQERLLHIKPEIILADNPIRRMSRSPKLHDRDRAGGLVGARAPRAEPRRRPFPTPAALNSRRPTPNAQSCSSPAPAPRPRARLPARGRDGLQRDRDRAGPARHALPERRRRSVGLRLQRVRAVRVRAARRDGAAQGQRISSARATTCRPSQLEPGDLVFFTTVAPGASHVGIALGGDEFVHAPSSTGEVRVERLSAAYWSTRFVGARRVL